METLVRRKIRFIAIKEGIEFDGKQDLRTKVMIALFGLFAEVERDLISERTKEGLAAAKAKGKLLGRPKGAVLRRVGKAGRVGDGPLTPQGVFEAVVSYARQAGLGKITPHDLRRTFAKLAHLGRAPLEQIQISLGHASIQTSERYLGLKQNLHDAPCDRLGIRGWEGVEG